MSTKLYSSSGQTPRRRAQEAGELLDRLTDNLPLLHAHERKFVEELYERYGEYGDRTIVSPKQIFWLRDLDEKCRDIRLGI